MSNALSSAYQNGMQTVKAVDEQQNKQAADIR